MTTRDRAKARANTDQMAQYTEIFITGHADEVDAFVSAVIRSGRLAQVSAPTPMGGHDPRIRRYLRLHSRK